MIPKKIYLRENELAEQFMCARMVSCDASIGSCSVEYTDLLQVWHAAIEEPKIGSNIVVINGNDKWCDIQPYDGGYSWRSWVSSYDIQRWAYIDDLLPKGGKK